MKRVTLLVVSCLVLVLMLPAAFAQYDCNQHDGNATTCGTAIASGEDCVFVTQTEDPFCGNASGCCNTKHCHAFDQTNQTACQQSSWCEWRPNGNNENPFCNNNVGCCEQKGCHSFINTNITQCTSFGGGGLCNWGNGTQTSAPDPFCPENVGCCFPQPCGELNETQCNASVNFGAPCSWTGSACEDQGFNFIDNQEDCTQNGGQWNSTGNHCIFNFGGPGDHSEGATCWFADDNPQVCLNVTGCVLCDSNNIANSSSVCFQEEEGLCEGHSPDDFGTIDSTGDPISCSNITIKSACNCGPLQHCKWTNSTTNIGNFCSEGVKTEAERQACQPPVTFCDDEQAKFNQTFCNNLRQTYFMPCFWDNETTPAQCAFDFESEFKDVGEGGGFEHIESETSCISAGGTWVSIQQLVNGIVEEEEFCEPGFGVGFEQCDDSCWACEFQPGGAPWASAAEAESACGNSSLGFCQWTNDAFWFNSQGRCEFPQEFSFGAEGCDSQCKDCSFMNDPENECVNSPANCQWLNDTNDCVSASKKLCSNDCYSCYDPSECGASAVSSGCSWDAQNNHCRPANLNPNQEICFDGRDNNNDGNIDCADESCQSDEFCGGSNVGTFANCKIQSNQSNCNATGCAWVIAPWGEQFCDAPGGNCWVYDTNETACNATNGCSFFNLTENSQPAHCDVRFNDCGLVTNETGCNQYLGGNSCLWVNDTFGGRCEEWIFGNCSQMQGQSACNANPLCNFVSFGPGGEGHCEPGCFGLNATNCGNATFGSYCEARDAFCESNSFSDCAQYDGNQTGCGTVQSCQWFPTGPGANDGFCDPAGEAAMFEHIDPSPPHILSDDTVEGVSPWVDIVGVGIKEMGHAFGIGTSVDDAAEGANCNGFPIHQGPTGNGQQEASFFWYLDTDGDETNGCNATNQNNNSVNGFEFFVKYTASWTGSETQDVKTISRCFNGTWVLINKPIAVNHFIMCDAVGGGLIVIEKEGLEEFDEYNDTSPLRVFAATADENGTATSPTDSSEEGYFTQGTVDFKFECCDCPNQDVDGDGIISDNDPDCRFVKNLGYVPFEICDNNRDDDNNNFADCNDPFCAAAPECGGSLTFTANANDKQAPSVTFLKAHTWFDGALIQFNTNEPSNATVRFYNNDSSCNSVNTTVNELGDPDSAFDDYKPFHDVPLDNYAENPSALSFGLLNGTTYFYKVSYCDPSGNCGASACLNFTTDAGVEDFVFQFPLPSGFSMDIPDLGISGSNMTFGITANATAANSINITINCDAAGYGMTLVGANILSATQLTLNNFTCDASSDLLGMASEQWQTILYNLGVESIILTFNSAGTALEHCNDDGTNCTDVTSFADCTFGASTTVCEVPVSVGFSSYTVTGSSSSGDSGSSSSSGGGSSGGGGGGGAVTVGGSTGDYTARLVKYKGTVPADEVASYAFSHTDIPITLIELELSEEAKSTRIQIATYDDRPEDIGEMTDVVYQYLSINETNLERDTFTSINVTFEVESSWLATNNVADEDVVLRFWDVFEWIDMPTRLVEAGVDTSTYVAELPHFSFYAIAAKYGRENLTAAEAPAAEPEVSEEPADEVAAEPVQQTVDLDSALTSVPWELISVILALVVIFGVAAALLKRKAFHHDAELSDEIVKKLTTPAERKKILGKKTKKKRK